MINLRLLAVVPLAVSVVACTAAVGESASPAETPNPNSAANLGRTSSPTTTQSSSQTAACETTFSAVRCTNMLEYAAMKLGTSREEIVSIEVLPPPTPELIDGVRVLQTRSGGPAVDTLVTLRDRSVHEVSMDCGGLPALQCRDEPELLAGSPTMAGYHDLPCVGDPPESCASPLAPPDPEALAAAIELRVARVDIAIDHDGHYEVPVGEATLPNGILSLAEFGFVSPGWPSDMTIADGVVRLEVRSVDDPDRLFWNIYDHGRVEGTERVEALLVFDVLHHEPGAVLSIAGLVVR